MIHYDRFERLIFSSAIRMHFVSINTFFLTLSLSITKNTRNKANRVLFSVDDYVGDESMINYDNESV